MPGPGAGGGAANTAATGWGIRAGIIDGIGGPGAKPLTVLHSFDKTLDAGPPYACIQNDSHFPEIGLI
jgi:hypothetical protein